jgi:hypothetical protein
MTGPHATHRAPPPGEQLVNWLALLALLALGIEWPHAAPQPAPAAPGARHDMVAAAPPAAARTSIPCTR